MYFWRQKIAPKSNETHYFADKGNEQCKEEMEMAGMRKGVKVNLSLIEKPIGKEKRDGYLLHPCRQRRKINVGFVQMMRGTRLYPPLLPTWLAQHLPAKIFTSPFHQCYIES